MKIGFIGIGQVGGTLAKRWGANGHSLFLGAREPENPRTLDLQKSIGSHAQIESIAKSIDQSDIIVLSTPWDAVATTIKDYSKNLEGKILVDCTNPLKPNLAGLLISGEESGGEYIQKNLPATQVVKAFNTVGFNVMLNPIFEGGKPIMYFCGNDEIARHKVQGLIQEIGFFPIDSGDIKSSRLLEPLALLWISTAYKFGMGREFAYSLVKRK